MTESDRGSVATWIGVALLVLAVVSAVKVEGTESLLALILSFVFNPLTWVGVGLLVYGRKQQPATSAREGQRTPGWTSGAQPTGLMTHRWFEGSSQLGANERGEWVWTGTRQIWDRVRRTHECPNCGASMLPGSRNCPDCGQVSRYVLPQGEAGSVVSEQPKVTVEEAVAASPSQTGGSEVKDAVSPVSRQAEKLRVLAQLHADGIVSDQEFAAKKAQLLEEF